MPDERHCSSEAGRIQWDLSPYDMSLWSCGSTTYDTGGENNDTNSMSASHDHAGQCSQRRSVRHQEFPLAASFDGTGQPAGRPTTRTADRLVETRTTGWRREPVATIGGSVLSTARQSNGDAPHAGRLGRAAAPAALDWRGDRDPAAAGPAKASRQHLDRLRAPARAVEPCRVDVSVAHAVRSPHCSTV